MEKQAKGVSTLSKKRYYDLENTLRSDFDDAGVDKIMSNVREILNFDPKMSTYNENIRNIINKSRHKSKKHTISGGEK